MPFAPLIQCNTCQRRRRLGSRLFPFSTFCNRSQARREREKERERAGNSGKVFGIWKMKSSNFCVFINIPIALFAIYTHWKPMEVGCLPAWLTAILCLLLHAIVCCCHIPFMVFIVCGNSCCLNYAKFTPQPNIASQQHTQPSPVHWQPMPNIIINIVSISILTVIIVVVTAALPAILVIFKWFLIKFGIRLPAGARARKKMVKSVEYGAKPCRSRKCEIGVCVWVCGTP